MLCVIPTRLWPSTKSLCHCVISPAELGGQTIVALLSSVPGTSRPVLVTLLLAPHVPPLDQQSTGRSSPQDSVLRCHQVPQRGPVGPQRSQALALAQRCALSWPLGFPPAGCCCCLLGQSTPEVLRRLLRS
ncbi:Hypothetical predicted protein [Marmota monax]|uniref:Uncharacterized protein n=1 Tax=Marmota monax TaxID=9995 RepID=A0A5E4BRE5_MARMO|nr:hypothetical protein GHT09_011657 [Marmota monax]VTJ72157.1 Hypothetical predicted protein [Marmota monax]